MKKKNGFTLVELLGVVALIGILVGIAVPSVINISTRIKKNMYCSKLDLMQSDAILWGEDHYGDLTIIENVKADDVSMEQYLRGTVTKTIGELVNAGSIKKDKNATDEGRVLDPRDDKSLENEKVYIYIRNKRVYAYIFPKNTDGTVNENLCD